MSRVSLAREWALVSILRARRRTEWVHPWRDHPLAPSLGVRRGNCLIFKVLATGGDDAGRSLHQRTQYRRNNPNQIYYDGRKLDDGYNSETHNRYNAVESPAQTNTQRSARDLATRHASRKRQGNPAVNQADSNFCSMNVVRQSELLATSEAWLNNLDDLDNLNMQKDRRSQ